jgi:hypothetical protein
MMLFDHPTLDSIIDLVSTDVNASVRRSQFKQSQLHILLLSPRGEGDRLSVAIAA